MRRRRRRRLAAAVLGLSVVAGTGAVTAVRAAPVPVPGTGVAVKDTQPDYAWDPACGPAVTTGCYVSQIVSFPSRRTGARLAATLYAPWDWARRGRLPAVVVIPPSGGAATQGSVSYLAKYLAIDHYIALTVDPQGIGNSDSLGDPPCGQPPGRTNPSPCANVPYQQMDNFFDAGQSALDFLLSRADPWAAHVNRNQVGATGHSEGARAASYLQDPAYDGRAKAVVALDNLTSSYCGDGGTPSQEGPGGQTGLQNVVINGQPGCLSGTFPVAPHGPALGIASDGSGGFGQDPPGTQPTTDQRAEKETAYRSWQSAGLDTMELVLAKVNHNQFSQTSTSDPGLIFHLAELTRTWFDLSFRNDATALQTMLGSCSLTDAPPLGTTPTSPATSTPLSALLSATYFSGVSVPAYALQNDDIRGTWPACQPAR